MFRTRTGRPVRIPRDFLLSVVLLRVRRNTRHGRAGTQLAAGPLQVCIFPSEPSRKDTVQNRGGWGADPVRSAILAHSDLVPRADSPRDSPSLAASSEERSTDSETGHLVVLGYLPQEEVDTSLWRERRLRDMLKPWSGTWSLNGALLTEKTPGSVRSESCSKGWSESCLPPPSKSMLLRLLPTTTLWKGSRGEAWLGHMVP